MLIAVAIFYGVRRSLALINAPMLTGHFSRTFSRFACPFSLIVAVYSEKARH